MLARGLGWERRALKYLQQAGLKKIAVNYRQRGGEIDLVMRDQNCLVFVEVRYRASGGHGGGAASIDQFKQRRIANTAAQFLQAHRQWSRWPCRFDVVAIDGSSGDPDFRWIRSAFEAPAQG